MEVENGWPTSQIRSVDIVWFGCPVWAGVFCLFVFQLAYYLKLGGLHIKPEFLTSPEKSQVLLTPGPVSAQQPWTAALQELIYYLNSPCWHFCFHPHPSLGPLAPVLRAGFSFPLTHGPTPWSLLLPFHLPQLFFPSPGFCPTWPRPPKPLGRVSLASLYARAAAPPLISLPGWVEKETYY